MCLEGFEKLGSPQCPFFLASALEVGRIRDTGKCFGETVAPLSNRLTIRGNVEPHEAIVLVDAMPVDEVQSAFGGGEPFFVWAGKMIDRGKKPSESALNPNALVGVEQTAVTIQRREIAAMRCVNSMR